MRHFSRRSFSGRKRTGQPKGETLSARSANVLVESVRLHLVRVPGATFSSQQSSQLATLVSFENLRRRCDPQRAADFGLRAEVERTEARLRGLNLTWGFMLNREASIISREEEIALPHWSVRKAG